MINNIISFLKDKKILILGFGKEGKSSLAFLRKYLPSSKITIADKNKIDIDINVDIIYGANYLDCLNDFDIILKSPGISLKNIDTSNINISSQLDLFLKFSNITTIGVTGTKGKTTTSTLIYNVLKLANKECFLLGNIGVPVFECLPQLTKNSIAVIEMSSHQLEFIKHSPNISVITNFYQEHLDHYLSYEFYINAKLNIFRFQKNCDYCIFNADQIEYLDKIKSACHSNQIKISLHNLSCHDHNCVSLDNSGNIIDKDSHFCVNNINNNLIGDHHFYDILFTFAVCRILNVHPTIIESSLKQFNGIPHRMEYVGKFNDIFFYNDSIATIPAAVINAIKSLKCVDTLIIGGMDRGIDYLEFAEFLAHSKISNIICLYETGQKIANMIRNYSHQSKIYVAKDLKDAVNFAFCNTKKNCICLLSPAAPSYGYFKNFEERGNEYKRLILSYNT